MTCAKTAPTCVVQKRKAHPPTFTEFSISSQASNITAGPDGALWFTVGEGNLIGRITTGGSLTEYPLSFGAPFVITTGPDGALWFTNLTGNNISQITTGGSITEYPLPMASSSPFGITTGPDSALWFTESGGNRIGRFGP